MTTNVKIQTNGNYVAELRDEGNTVVASVGPGNNVESNWIHVPHGSIATLSERDATAEEIAKAHEEANKAAAEKAE